MRRTTPPLVPANVIGSVDVGVVVQQSGTRLGVAVSRRAQQGGEAVLKQTSIDVSGGPGPPSITHPERRVYVGRDVVSVRWEKSRWDVRRERGRHGSSCCRHDWEKSLNIYRSERTGRRIPAADVQHDPPEHASHNPNKHVTGWITTRPRLPGRSAPLLTVEPPDALYQLI